MPQRVLASMWLVLLLAMCSPIAAPAKPSPLTIRATPIQAEPRATPPIPSARPDAALRADGHLLLPIQGRVLVDLDSVSGKSVALPLQANTHQHGVALTPDGRHLLIVGTGLAGDAQGPPRLTMLDLATMAEQDIPLSRPHEQVALSPDGRLAYVTGGHSFGNAGWDGVSVVDLQRHSVSELAVPDRPLDIVILSVTK